VLEVLVDYLGNQKINWQQKIKMRTN